MQLKRTGEFFHGTTYFMIQILTARKVTEH